MDRPTRKDIRLSNYDYSRNGAYFVTICTHNKMCIFWADNDKYKPLIGNTNNTIGNAYNTQNVEAASRRPQNDEKIHLSEYGKIVKNELKKIPLIYPDIVFIPKFVVMPNHVHVIIVINNNDVNNGRRNAAPTISRIMNQFKGSVSKQSGFSVWQRSFYDRVLRNEHEYRGAWQYIENNPANWENDELFSKEYIHINNIEKGEIIMIKLSLPDGSVREIEAAQSAAEIIKGIGMGLYKAACCVKINGEVKDLRTVIDSDCQFEVCTFDSIDGKKTFWHTASHILAQAVKRLYPAAKLAIGPAIDNGFYYDFDLEKPFTPEELEKIEAEMKKIVKEGLELEKFELSPADAIAKLKEMDEPYKVELCEEHADKGEPISFYKQGEFIDLCAGPHLMTTAPVKAFKLLSCTGAYWRGNEKNKMLSRVYAIAFPKAAQLDEYIKMIEEAKLRDHKKLGKELSLFMFDHTAPGMPYWLPRGWKLFNALLEYWRGVHEDHGYTEISGPVLSKKELWVTSGHWDHYQDGMFVIPSEEENEVYCAKPMNCPNAIKAYMNKQRSYKELPLKFNQVDVIHRKEKSGELNGLFRVQQFRQDDAHILVTEEQIASEINDIMDIATEIYNTFGLEYKAELSTRPDDFMGDIKVWDKAEADLKAILEEKYGPDGYELNEGDGAFYGPKIDLKMKDAIGREWQMGTIQLDFQLPLNFKMKYIASDGSEKQPVMIHRAIFGSFERFIGIITENFAGAFPFWLSPMQVGIVPIRTEHNEYAKKVAALLKKNHIRAEADYTDDNMKNKIRRFKDYKDPYVVIIGDSEAENEQVSINIRGNKQLKNIPLEKFIEMCTTMNEEHSLDIIDTL